MFCLNMDQQETQVAVCFHLSGTTVHYMDIIMLIGHNEKKVASILDTLVRKICARR